MAQAYSKGKTTRPRHDNFLEALRDLGRDTVQETSSQLKKAVTSDIPEMFGLASGTLRPNESISLSPRQPERSPEQQAEARFARELQHMREQEYAALLRNQAQAKEQIKAIQAEILNLTQAAGELFKEVEVAAAQAPVSPGVYHKNFFTQLRSLIVTLRKRVQNSKEWLSVTNSRAGKRGYFWGQVKKSGTSFMLSSERYAVMSTG